MVLVCVGRRSMGMTVQLVRHVTGVMTATPERSSTPFPTGAELARHRIAAGGRSDAMGAIVPPLLSSRQQPQRLPEDGLDELLVLRLEHDLGVRLSASHAR
jgi:hypothetical protein